MPTISSMIDLEDFIDNQCGARGTAARETFEEGCEAFKLSAMLQEMREENNITQEQLAAKNSKVKV